jgi:hypothetical protein
MVGKISNIKSFQEISKDTITIFKKDIFMYPRLVKKPLRTISPPRQPFGTMPFKRILEYEESALVGYNGSNVM